MRKELKKVLPAVNLPQHTDGRIDEEAFRRHLRGLAQFDIGGMVISGHAGELESLTPEERFQVAKIARCRFPRSTVRPPFQPLRPDQIKNIQLAIQSAGLGVELRATA